LGARSCWLLLWSAQSICVTFLGDYSHVGSTDHVGQSPV